MEDRREQIKVLLKEALLAQLHHRSKILICLRLLLDVKLGVGKHGLKRVLETLWVTSLVGIILLVVSNSEDGLQELCVVKSVHNVERIRKWNGHTINFMHAFAGG